MSEVTEWPDSKFSGLWTDRVDAIDELERRIAHGAIPPGDRGLYESFIALGYAIIPGAVDQDLCRQLSREIHEAWTNGDSALLTQYPGSHEPIPLTTGLDPAKMRVVDIHVHSSIARDILFSDRVTAFLREVFRSAPLLFQSLTFERGSEQGFHQDTAYVVVDEPRRLAAAWIALEDVNLGSGELRYIPRSHRLPEFLFSEEFKHWNADRDGHDQHEEWSRYLIATAQALELQEERFFPKTGDVLIWAADLVHGGSPVDQPSLTRRSLVGHFCPETVRPNYFEFAPERSQVLSHGGGCYSSYHLRVRD